MSCNCGNTFRKFLPGQMKPKRPEVKIIKKAEPDNKEEQSQEIEKKDENL